VNPFQTGDLRESRNANLSNIATSLRPMPASLMNFAHFSVSLAKSSLKSAADIGIGSHPRSASRSLILGSARPAVIARLSLPIISPSVSRGAVIPKNRCESTEVDAKVLCELEVTEFYAD
jgi:hypothetical protein